MNEAITLMLSGLAGVGLGAVFFGGLWWTLRKGLTSRQPARWQLGSALLRMGVALAGFYVVGAGSWQRMLACATGFVIARMLIMRWVTQPRKHAAGYVEGARHAPGP